MKKLLVIIMVLGMATATNAGLKISVNDVVDPQGDIVLNSSDTVKIDVWSDGQDIGDSPIYLAFAGPASIDLSGAINAVNPTSPPFVTPPDWYPEDMAGNVFIDVVIVAVPVPNLPAGVIADGIVMHCDGLEDVLITLFRDARDIGGELLVMDTQIIHQPEPITIALLGLGGLFLRRRK